jgi:ubiquinone/menaquinone biosynthesis C-methylase UbiE
MTLPDAINLIQQPDYRSGTPSTWVDLGCGTGLFTKALATLVAPGSVIYALDTNQTALNGLTDVGQVAIKTVCQDFVRSEWPVETLDGILMANSLHYVNDKPAFLKKAKQHLTDSGCFLIVEYDTDSANPWVPYPISYKALTQLFNEAGFSSVEKLRERPSVYGRANLYATLIKR